MKKLLLAALTIATMAACTTNTPESENTITEAQIKGVWVFDKVNNKEITTNEFFAADFAGGYQDYMQWADLDGTQSTIIYKDAVPYTISTDTLTLHSTEDHIVLKISIEDDAMEWLEVEKIIGGEDFYAGNSYQGYRTEVDYTTQITKGIWEGRATEGRTTNPYLRLEFKADGSYDFQHRDSEDEPWSQKLDNDGRYYLLGELLGTAWTNDINSGTEGQSSETWIISIEEETMEWVATRTGDHFEKFVFTRVE